MPTNSKQLPAFPFEAVPGTEPRPQRWEARVLPFCYSGPYLGVIMSQYNLYFFSFVCNMIYSSIAMQSEIILVKVLQSKEVLNPMFRPEIVTKV